jgi:hypothetical protein
VVRVDRVKQSIRQRPRKQGIAKEEKQRRAK